MNTLYPIIRRARRPLLPPDEPAPAVPPKAAEPPPISSPVAPPVEAIVETVVEAALPARRPRKERNRAETPAT